MKIFLVRHGDKQSIESTDNTAKRSVPLSQLGIKQVESLSQFLKENYPQLLNLDFAYSSPIARAIQTANILKNKLNIKEIKIDSSLEELFATNDYSISKEDRNKMFHRAMDDINFIPDTKVSFRSHIEKLLEFIKQSYRHTDLLLLSTHGGLIRSTIYCLFPQLKPPFDKILESGIHNGGLTILDFDCQQFHLDKFDYSDHLKFE